MHILAVAGLALLGGIVLLLALIGALYLTRGTPVHGVVAWGDPDGPPAVGDDAFLETMGLIARVHLQKGHTAAVAINGDQTYERLWDDLRAAKQTLTLQMYYFQPGRMAETFREILEERARAGVRVLLLHDAFGSQHLKKKYLESLEAAGVQIAAFRPVKWYQLHKAQHRSHIRVAICDGRVGWTGGFGIDDKWYGDGRHEDQWRDTNVRFEGPAVLEHQATFVAGWAEATGQILTGDLFFPPAEHDAGDMLAALMHCTPTIGSTSAERFLALTIAGARRTLYVTNSYFVPDEAFCDLLGDAAERGVDVRVLTAGANSDVKSTWWAGRARYEKLLERGVRIFEYRPCMMHAKTIVADALWCGIGTLNFDNRSLAFNDETVFLVSDEGLGGDMEQIFREDLGWADEIHLEEFRRRGTGTRVMERLATSVSRLL